MPAKKSPEFEKAVDESTKLKEKPTQDEMLDLYKYFKQGSQDPPFEEAKKPGMLDMTGKYKRSAWEEVVKEGMTPEEAQEKYVELVNSLKEKYGFDG